jgi:two-component sensor histidine kinase
MLRAGWNGLATSVQSYLLLIAAGCTVPLALVGGYFAYHVALEASERSKADLDERLNLMRSAVEQRIDRVAAQLEVLAHSPDLQAGDLTRFREHAVEANKLIRGITVLLADRNGDQIINTRPFPPGQPIPRRKNLVAQNRAWESAEPQVSDLYPATVDGKPVISVEVPIFGASHQVKYILAAGIVSSTFADLMDQYVPSGAIGSIIDRNGVLIARRPTEAGLIGKKTIPAVLAHIGEPFVFWMKATSRTGVPTYSSLLRSPQTGWSVNLAVPREVIDGPLRQTVIIFFSAGIAAVILGLLLARAISQRFLRAFATLQDHVRRLASQDLVLPAQGPVSEINKMDDTLHLVGTTLLEAAQRQQVLLDEVNHRVKNTLATIQAIIRLSLPAASSLKSYASSLEQRILALSTAYNLLTQTDWQGADIESIVQKILSPFDLGGRAVLTGAHVTLRPKLALAFAAAVQELCTNASKYGALSVPAGRLDARWTIGESGIVNFTWVERDGPSVQKPTRRGFGTRFIQEVLAADANWDAVLDYAPAGLRCIITIQT